MTDIRHAFRAGAAAAVAAVARSEVADRVDEDSVLPGMRIGALAAHLARAVTQTADYLDEALASAATADDDDAVLDGPGYYGSIDGLDDRSSEINQSVIARAEASSEGGATAVATHAADALARIERAIDTVPAHFTVVVLGGRRITIDEYLRTRCVELAVHLDDLAVSLGVELELPASTATVAAEMLAAVAVLQSGGPATLRAMCRGERAEQPVFPVF